MHVVDVSIRRCIVYDILTAFRVSLSVWVVLDDSSSSDVPVGCTVPNQAIVIRGLLVRKLLIASISTVFGQATF